MVKTLERLQSIPGKKACPRDTNPMGIKRVQIVNNKFITPGSTVWTSN
jgi:hypothetical protein